MSSREESDVINLLSLGTIPALCDVGWIPSQELTMNHQDGGGVRGVASLLILHQIMVNIREIQGLDEVPKPCDYFHMIGGTSTGG